MNVWLDGLGVLADKGWVIVSIFLIVIWGQILIVNVFQKIFKDRLTRAEYFSLGMAGWLLPVAFTALLLFGGVYLFGENMVEVVFIVTIILFLYIILTRKPAPGSLLVYSVLILFLVGSVFLHLIFLRKVIFPLYFDSAEHYRIIKYFLEYFAASNGGTFPAWPLTNYYHVGYHFLIASFSALLQTNIVDTMLVSGQLMVSVLPLSLFFIIRRETGSDIAALFTSLLAGFGWHMPGHAVNWGKYPALFSLISIHFVLCIAYLIFRNNIFRLERPKLFLMLSLGILVSGFIHTRSLIVYAFLFLSLLLLLLWKRLPALLQYIGFALVIGVLVFEISYTRTDSMLVPLLNTNIHNDLFATGLVLFLAVFSAQAFADVTFFSLIMLSLLLSGLFIPVGGFFPAYDNLVLLDRPYVQMLLYLPLSILGGLGLAGLHQFVHKISLNPKFLSQLITIVMFGFVTLNVAFNYDFYPSSCCQIVGRDDLAAFDWMDKNLPLDANILIASTGMYVTSAEQADGQSGVDGGIWITPLISRKTIPMPSGLGFDQPEIRDEICSRNTSYVYDGGETLSFDYSLLEKRPAWYQVVLFLPGAKIYKVIGCK